MIDTVTIIQHNVLHWKTNKTSLLNNYLSISPEIIAINSHGLKAQDSLKIPGYKTYKINSSQDIADGSAIAVKHNLQHKLFDDYDTDFLAVEIQTSLGPILIATTYLPPRRPYLPFTDMYKLLNNNIPTYILGDFNGTHKYFGNRADNTVGKSLISLINQGKMLHLGPSFPTFFKQDSATNPDKIFSNNQHFLNYLIEPGNISTSDHLPIIFKLSAKPFLVQKTPIYNVHKANWDLFKRTLDEQITISNLNNRNTEVLEEEIEKWIKSVKKAMDIAIPKSNIKRIVQLNITEEIMNLERQFKVHKQAAITNGWTNDNYREYIKIRTELREKCKEAQIKSWEEKIKNIIDYTKDTKEFWRKIKTLKGNDVIYTNYIKDSEGRKYYTDKEKCEVLEKTWKEVFKITDEDEANFDIEHSDHINAYINININRVKYFQTVDISRLNNENHHAREITIDEMKGYIWKFKNKAPGTSKINKQILVKCTDKAMEQLNNIFNACFSTGYFPRKFKNAIIKFIPKEKKSPQNPMNYRPISLLEVPGKLYERVILARLNTFLSEKNILKDRQHGFRPYKGTHTAITTTYETIANALAGKQQVYVVLRDVAKAFDKVWHNGLKYKLLQLGLPETLEKTLCNFLDNRTAKIQIGKDHGNTINLLSGVPQGSVLSPTLYTLFTNDLPEPGHGNLITMFADDITQVITSQNKSKLMMKLKVEREIEKINKYEKMWKIRTSEEKFKIIPVAQHKTKPIVINNKEINTSKEGKFLGLRLQHTGIAGHCTQLKNKGNAVLNKLRRFTNLTPKLKSLLVKTQLIPILEYPPIPLCAASKTQKKSMQTVLNKALRFINQNEEDKPIAEELHLRYNITPLNISIHNKARKIWENVRCTEPEHYENLIIPHNRKHNWFPKTCSVIATPSVEAIIT